MKTYDKGAGSLGAAPTRRSLRQLFKRWIDRERELISLRNAVGMMGEARRADAAEYHAMALTLQSTRERLTRLENCAPLIGKATWDVLDQRAQQKRQGYTAEHDDQHGGGSLARAAAAYLLTESGVPVLSRVPPASEAIWPWSPHDYKPRSYRENLVRGTAMALAEIERIDRRAAKAVPA